MLSLTGGPQYETTDKKNRSGCPARRFSLLPLSVCSLFYYFERGTLMQKCFQSFPKPYLKDSYNSKASRSFGAVLTDSSTGMWLFFLPVSQCMETETLKQKYK
jgi:hypothetical protein